jgi:4-hydroxybenzoate polyprenyltransferase
MKKSADSAQTASTLNHVEWLAYLKTLRPKQWTKNGLLFAAVAFSVHKVEWMDWMDAILGFVVFCLISGVVYIMNDVADIEKDRVHPQKRTRPIAAGQIKPSVAIGYGIAILIISLFVAFMLGAFFGFIALAYFALNIAYSFYLKHIVIIDIMSIASGFVLRAVAGAAVIHQPLTAWFLVCTMLLALFLAVSKRRHELIGMSDNPEAQRKVLRHYSVQLLDQMISIVTTAAIISYALFTFTSGHSLHLMWTIPLVVYGIFRYLYLIYQQDKGGSPEQVLLEDKPILITVLLFGLVSIAIVYLSSKGLL